MVGGWGFMDIRVLEYYLIVAREESITKAAAILHVTHPPANAAGGRTAGETV